MREKNEAELSHWKVKYEMGVHPPPSPHTEPEASLLPIHTNLAKKKKITLHEILKAAFKLLPLPPGILKGRVILCWWGKGLCCAWQGV